MKHSLLLAFALLATTAETLAKERDPAPPTRNVQVGGDENSDACGGDGIVSANTTLYTVKNGKAAREKIAAQASVKSCDEWNDAYIGIVFGKPEEDCNVSSPIEKRGDYKGPCKSGWIKKEFFELQAG